MGRKLNVSNLPTDVDADQLRELFGQYGTVDSARLIKDVKTGESIGAATVAMKSSRESKAAAEALHGTVQFEHEITVVEVEAPSGGARTSSAPWGNQRSAGSNSRMGFGQTGHQGKARGGDR